MRLRLPHTFVLLFALTAMAAALTWAIPAGEYARREVSGRRVVDPTSYHRVAAEPAGPLDVLQAWPRGLEATASIVFYLFLVGGAFGVVQATGALEAGIEALVRAAGARGARVIPLLVALFSLGGGTIGLAEEVLAFLPALVLLVRRLGYDDLLAGVIGLAGAGAGFAGAFLNPFTVGVGQAIAGLPLFSGMGYRLVVWGVLTAVTMAWIARAARRLRLPDDAATAGGAAPAAPASAAPDLGVGAPLSWRHAAVLLALLATVALLVAGALAWGWGLLELSALFVATGVVAGLAGGLGANRTAESFVAGAAGFAGAALVVGLARGGLVVLDGARVTDTILHALVETVRELPASLTVTGVYAVQVALSYVVPSGSGQAALSLPILVPLGDVVGVTRQTSVLAYQLGDGFSNVFTPTQGYFMAGLAMIGVSWPRWVRFLWPLQAIWLVLGLALLLVAHAIGWS